MDVGARIRLRFALALGVAVLPLLFASAAAAATFTWTGLGSSPSFSNTSNWNSSSPLSGATSLVFGPLSGPCNTSVPSDTCYHATNDESGISVSAISFDDSLPYLVQGNPIALGTDGFTAVDSGGNFVGGWSVPLNLTASQTWSITGELDMGASVRGTGSALTVNFEHAPGAATGWFLYGGDSEVGPVQLNGGQLQLGAATAATTLNAGDGHPIGLNSAQLFLDGPATVGSLTSAASRVDLSTHVLTVTGQVSFDGHSTMGSLLQAPGSGNFGVLDATGAVTIAGNLDVQQIGAGGAGTACSPLPVGSGFTIASAGGPMTGTFADAPPGATLPTWAGCPRGQGTTTLAQIAYTPHSVAATIVAAPSLSTVQTALSSTINPSAGQLKVGSLLKHGGYTTAWPAIAGLLSIDLTAKAHGKQVLVAVVNASFNGAHPSTIPVKLTKAGRRVLKNTSKLNARVEAVFEPAWNPLVAPTVHRTLTLKP